VRWHPPLVGEPLLSSLSRRSVGRSSERRSGGRNGRGRSPRIGRTVSLFAATPRGWEAFPSLCGAYRSHP
jgi:hypothetical protein